MERPVAYISGPISKGDLLHNIKQADDAFLALVRLGFAPINPMWSVYAGGAYRVCGDGDDRFMAEALRNSSLPLEHADWLDVDLNLVRRADAVLRLPGESVGADMETAEAKSCGLPVFTSIDEARVWLEGGDNRRSFAHPWIRSILPPRKNGKRHDTHQLVGWVTRGLIGTDGERHKLPAVKIRGQYAVRTADLRAFLAAVGDAATR